jgi:GDP-4-dehydro-6-deoxy-D-mannose reductase
MPERVLITGSTGFIGTALERCARQAGSATLGVGLTAQKRAGYRPLDLGKGPVAISALLEEWRPDVVFHLAGGTGRGDSFTSNVVPTRNLLLGLRSQQACAPRVVVIGSAAEYGDVGSEPVTEQARERPTNEHGVAKLAQTRLALVFRRAGVRVTVARPFNIIGPGISPALAPARFAREAIAAVAAGRGTITVGDLSTVRDYLDVEDVARALWLLGHADFEEEIVNVCSGRGVSTREVLDEILHQVGGSLIAVTDPSLVRGPADVPVSIGSPERLRSLTGQSFAFSLPRAVARLLESLKRSGGADTRPLLD